MVKSHYIGDGHPTFNRNPYNGYIKPYYWLHFPIRYYREIMGVDRPWHIYLLTIFQANYPPYVCKSIQNKNQTLDDCWSRWWATKTCSYFMSFCDDHQDVLAPRYIAHIHLSE